MDGNSVFRVGVSNSSVVTLDLAITKIVCGLGTNEETIAHGNGISGEGWAFEDVAQSADVETGLLELSANEGFKLLLALLCWSGSV